METKETSNQNQIDNQNKEQKEPQKSPKRFFQKSSQKLLVAVLLAILILTLAGYLVWRGYFSKEGVSKTLMSPGAYVAQETVTIENTGFNPKKLVVRVGTQVIWVNKDTEEHRVAMDDPSGFMSEALKTDSTFTHTFYNKGDFPYHSELKPELKGSVIVK